MRRFSQLVIGIVASVGLLLLDLQAAYADNCGNISDCFNTTDAAIAAAVGLAILIGLGIGLGAFALGTVGDLLAEAAAEGLVEGATEAIGEMVGEASLGESAAEAELAAEAVTGEAEAEVAAEAATSEAEAVSEVQSAVESAEADPNKVSHIFDQARHNWDLTGLDQQGNWNLIRNTLQNNYGQLPSGGVYQITQNFGNYSVTVRGAVVNGVVRIGSAWVNAL